MFTSGRLPIRCNGRLIVRETTSFVPVFLEAISLQHNLDTVGQTVPVLVEGDAKKSSSQWMGKTDGGITVVWEKDAAPLQPEALVPITVTRVTATTLFGHPVAP
jgi:tRNA A37 methylthiotransferase MiaB